MCYFVIDALINRQFYYHQINSVVVLLLNHWECSTILTSHRYNTIGTCKSSKDRAVSMIHKKKGEQECIPVGCVPPAC